jgi:adenine-specific DNA-methyltransferase
MTYELIKNQQLSLLTELTTNINNNIKIKKISVFNNRKSINKVENKVQIQNRRFLGNKYKLLSFIDHIVYSKCNSFESFCDIFGGTGIVGNHFNKKEIKIISNDLLLSNYIPLKAFLGSENINLEHIERKIDILNNTITQGDNYFSENYGGTFFTIDNARKIGFIRDEIEEISDNEEERAILLTSLIYAVDKVANTVGHYDAFRKKLDSTNALRLLCPDIRQNCNANNEIYREDANILIRKISCDVLYIDPPYNSRQYCDTYHLLENLVNWKKPPVKGKAKKMDRSNLKSAYCLTKAGAAFADLIENANCKHIFISYNNTGESMNGRSNARISDEQLINILKRRGEVEIFEYAYKAFTTGKSNTNGHTERLFYCKITK